MCTSSDGGSWGILFDHEGRKLDDPSNSPVRPPEVATKRTASRPQQSSEKATWTRSPYWAARSLPAHQVAMRQYIRNVSA